MGNLAPKESKEPQGQNLWQLLERVGGYFPSAMGSRRGRVPPHHHPGCSSIALLEGWSLSQVGPSLPAPRGTLIQGSDPQHLPLSFHLPTHFAVWKSRNFLLPALFFFASFIQCRRIHKPGVPLMHALPLEHQLLSVHTYYQLKTKPCLCPE